MKSSGPMESAGGWMTGVPILVLILAGVVTPAPVNTSIPVQAGPQARIIEVDQAACRANMQALADAEEVYLAEHGVYTDPVGLDEPGILPGAWQLRCPYDGSMYTVTFSSESFVITCMCPHSHGRIVDGMTSWGDEPLVP